MLWLKHYFLGRRLRKSSAANFWSFQTSNSMQIKTPRTRVGIFTRGLYCAFSRLDFLFRQKTGVANPQDMRNVCSPISKTSGLAFDLISCTVKEHQNEITLSPNPKKPRHVESKPWISSEHDGHHDTDTNQRQKTARIQIDRPRHYTYQLGITSAV